MPSPEHSLPLIVIAVAAGGIIGAARRWPSRWVEAGARVLAFALVVAEVSWWGIAVLQHSWTVRYNLPLHLCEACSLLLAAGLWWRPRFAVEISYFWALGGTLPGLFTPNIPGHFPDAVYFQYYLEHGCIVLGAFYLVLILRLQPAQGAVLRVSLATAAYAATVGVVDYLTGGNYLFLREIPQTRTLFDYMGPWPWYILTCTVLAVAIFWLLNLPFDCRVRKARSWSGPPSVESGKVRAVGSTPGLSARRFF